MNCDTHGRHITGASEESHFKTEKTRLTGIVCLDSERNPSWVAWHAWNFRSREMGVGESRIQGYLLQPRVLKTNLHDRMPSYRRR